MTPPFPSSRLPLLFTATDRSCPRLCASILRISFAAAAPSHSSPLSSLSPSTPSSFQPACSKTVPVAAPASLPLFPHPLLSQDGHSASGLWPPSAGSPKNPSISPATDNVCLIYAAPRRYVFFCFIACYMHCFSFPSSRRCTTTPCLLATRPRLERRHLTRFAFDTAPFVRFHVSLRSLHLLTCCHEVLSYFVLAFGLTS
jgi:hypothetical protein